MQGWNRNPIGLCFALGLFASLHVGCNSIEQMPHPRARNVLLVSIDTLRADHVGAYGDPDARTPRLDRLAAEGTRFAAAFSPAPLTLPTHSTLMTGLDPFHHGVRHNGIHRLQERVDTLAERFDAAGYRTAAFVGSLVLAAHSGLAQGFDVYDDAMRPTGDHASAQRRGEAVNRAAIQWLEGVEDDFFLFVHYYDPHRPYEPPKPFADDARSPYDGEISYADALLGELLDVLESTGRLEKTLVVVTSDHGEGLGEHDELTHGHAIYDATQHVPLILHGPGIPRGRVVDSIARTADIAPTLIARMNLRPLETMDGEDLAPLWRADAPIDRLAYLETMATRYDHGWSPLHGLRSRDHLYIDAPQPELYEVASDPAQTTNLLGEGETGSERIAEFEHELSRRMAESVTAEETRLDPAMREQLHALGYAIPETPRAETGLDPKIGRRSLALYHEGDALYQAGRPAEAADRFARMLELSPESGEAWISLGAARLNAGELEAAREATLEGVERMPTKASARGQLGVIEMALGHLDAAEARFREAIDLEPEAAGPRGRLLRVLVAQGRIEEALAVDREIDELDWTNVVWLRRIADFWESEGRTAVALGAYQRVLALDPDSQRDHMHVAIALIRLGRLDEARPHLERSGDVLAQPRARKALEAGYLEAGYTDEARRLRERFAAAG